MTKTVEAMLAKTLLEVVDNNAHLLTVLDLQARLLARLEGREEGEVVAEVNEMLKVRSRAALGTCRRTRVWSGPRLAPSGSPGSSVTSATQALSTSGVLVTRTPAARAATTSTAS